MDIPWFRSAIIAAAFPISLLAVQSPQPPAPPQLSPHAAYQSVTHPFNATRDAIGNWSDIELQALSVAMKQAATECAARHPKDFSGDDLMDLARLCALGQSWPTVVEATSLYIADDTPSKPRLIQAYAARLDAELYLKNEPAALADGETMLATLPYDGLTAQVITESLNYMQFNFTADALKLATLREPIILEHLHTTPATPSPTEPQPKAPTPAPPALITTPSPTTHELYDQGLAFAALLQLSAKIASASDTVAALDASLPPSLPPDESLPIATSRKRYAILGQPLPPIASSTFLMMPQKLPQIPAAHALTVLLIFPDWCIQCIRMTRELPISIFLVRKYEAYAYAVLAETSLLPSPVPNAQGVIPPTPRDLLAETPTVVATPSVLDQFAAIDFPTMVVTDPAGIVRVLQPVSESAVKPGDTLDSAIASVGAFWPILPPPSTPKPPAPGQPSSSP